jgi:hypothetical protein
VKINRHSILARTKEIGREFVFSLVLFGRHLRRTVDRALPSLAAARPLVIQTETAPWPEVLLWEEGPAGPFWMLTSPNRRRRPYTPCHPPFNLFIYLFLIAFFFIPHLFIPLLPFPASNNSL